MAGTKHLIQCHCILPQYRNMNDPLFHKFVVYSTLNEHGEANISLAKCNNCGVVHKVIDFCKSEVMIGHEDSMAVVTIEDVRSNIPEKIAEILEKHHCDIATWQHVEDIFDNEEWGSVVTISTQKAGDSTQIKSVKINSESRFKVRADLRKDEMVVL